jgi:hypothetical protein
VEEALVVVEVEEAVFNLEFVLATALADAVFCAALTPVCCANKEMLDKVTDANANRKAVLIAISSETFLKASLAHDLRNFAGQGL